MNFLGFFTHLRIPYMNAGIKSFPLTVGKQRGIRLLSFCFRKIKILQSYSSNVNHRVRRQPLIIPQLRQSNGLPGGYECLHNFPEIHSQTKLWNKKSPAIQIAGLRKKIFNVSAGSPMPDKPGNPPLLPMPSHLDQLWGCEYQLYCQLQSDKKNPALFSDNTRNLPLPLIFHK